MLVVVKPPHLFLHMYHGYAVAMEALILPVGSNSYLTPGAVLVTPVLCCVGLRLGRGAVAVGPLCVVAP